MPTNVELKNTIDTALNSSLADFSITPEIQATQIKSVIDYVDQEVSSTEAVVKTIKRTITSAEILNLFDTPIVLLNSTTPSDKIKLPLNIWCQRKPGDAYSLAAASFQLINDLGTAVSGNINPNPLSGTDIGFFTSAFSITQNAAGADRNATYSLRAASGNPTGGTGDLDVYLTYIEFTL
jgi:hypothetical protein